MIAANSATAYNQVIGRNSKPFDALLGETFELVTPDFKLLVEMVSQCPPIAAVHIKMDQAEVSLISDTDMQFQGKQITVKERRPGLMTLIKPDGSRVRIRSHNPPLVVGNLIMGERFTEPQGPCKFENLETGEVCTLEFKPRGGWFSSAADF